MDLRNLEVSDLSNAELLVTRNNLMEMIVVNSRNLPSSLIESYLNKLLDVERELTIRER